MNAIKAPGLIIRGLLLFVVLFVSFVPSSYALTDDQWEGRTHWRINQMKVAYDLPRVRYGPCIDRFAERHARRLAREQMFYHQRLDPILDRCGGRRVGEVMTLGAPSPKVGVTMWLNSPEHRAILLDGRYDRLGVGAVTTRYGTIVVAVFKDSWR